jgi:hypothetical protein
MRKLVYLFILVFSFLSCTSDDGDKTIDSELIGTWKMTEAFISSGGPQYWVDVENGEDFEFFENGMFSSTRFSECTTGTFSVEQNKLVLQYNCNGFESTSENQDGFITYDLKFEADTFIATPTSGPICIEGCSYKYQKN